MDCCDDDVAAVCGVLLVSRDLDEDDTEDKEEEDNSVEGTMVEVVSSCETAVVGTATLVGAKEDEEEEDVTDEVEVIDVEVNNDVEAEDETMDVWVAVEDAGMEELLETTVLFTELDILGTIAELSPD